MDLLSIIFAIIASISTFIACLYGLHRLWLQPHQSEIPVETGQYFTDSPRKKMSPDELIRVKSLSELLEAYIPLILKLDSRYWIHNIGLDGYTYLYFQRELIKMLLVYGIVSFIIMIPVSIWFAGVKLPASVDEPIPESDSDYTRYYEQLYAIIITIMSYFFSLYAIYTLFEIRDHIKSQLIDQNFATTKRHDYEALKARSVHIRGLFPEDRKGEMLCSGVEKFLEASGGGKIVSTMVVPDFVRIIELEGDRKRVDNAYKLLLANEPAVRRIFFPKKYRQEAYYEKKLNSIEDKIEQELMKPVTCSGHAFMCFDSIKTRDHCLEYFKENEYKTWKDLLDKVANQDALVPKKSMLKRKFTSTFQKFDDKDLLESLQDQELKVVMDRLERPFDIFWSNMGGSRDRRILIKLFAFLALIFLSTPAALFSVIQKVPGLNYLDFSQYIPATEFGTFLKQLSLPVWIIILNQLLLFLIDFSAYEEKHHSFTLCQISIFSKSLFYLMFNMFLIPALTLVTSGEKANVSHFTSLFTLFYGVIFEGSSLADILRQLYTSTAGNFFIIFLFQNAGFSSGFGLLRIGEIVGAFGSTWLAHYQRTCMNDMDRWRKREIDVFKYGFLCAQIVVALAVVVSYTATTPGIILAGLAFLLMRYSVDGFNLLTVYKMEIDSDGKMIQSILKYAAMACLLHQFAMGVSYYYEGFMIPCILIAILILVTIFLSYQISKPITADEKDLFDMSQEIMRANIKDTREDIHKWETAYRHPLLVSPEEGSRGEREISVSRGSRTLSHVTVR